MQLKTTKLVVHNSTYNIQLTTNNLQLISNDWPATIRSFLATASR